MWWLGHIPLADEQIDHRITRWIPRDFRSHPRHRVPCWQKILMLTGKSEKYQDDITRDRWLILVDKLIRVASPTWCYFRLVNGCISAVVLSSIVFNWIGVHIMVIQPARRCDTLSRLNILFRVFSSTRLKKRSIIPHKNDRVFLLLIESIAAVGIAPMAPIRPVAFSSCTAKTPVLLGWSWESQATKLATLLHILFTHNCLSCNILKYTLS